MYEHRLGTEPPRWRLRLRAMREVFRAGILIGIFLTRTRYRLQEAKRHPVWRAVERKIPVRGRLVCWLKGHDHNVPTRWGLAAEYESIYCWRCGRDFDRRVGASEWKRELDGERGAA